MQKIKKHPESNQIATGLLDVIVFIGNYNNRLTQWF